MSDSCRSAPTPGLETCCGASVYRNSKRRCRLKIELQRELEDSRIVACRDDAAEVAGIEDPSRCWVNAAAGGNQGIQVADRICQVWVIEQVEELSAKFEIASFGQRKELFDCKIHIYLSRSAQTGSADVSDTCAHCVPVALSHLMGPSWQDI